MTTKMQANSPEGQQPPKRGPKFKNDVPYHQKYPVPDFFVDWLHEGTGRSAWFSRVDPALAPSVISKMKAGRIPITFEYAIRIERAQKPSDKPLRAYDLMTFKEHRELYLYVTGQAAPPEPSPVAYKPGMPTHQPRTVAIQEGAGAA